MLKTILIAIAVILVVFLIVVAVQPADFRVTRNTTISAPPASVFAQVNDFHNWEAWSPWEKLDPTMKRSFEGPSAGTGAIYRWVGNKKVGEGNMTITDSRPNGWVRFRLEFIKPFASVCATEFNLKPHGSGTDVTWSMTGKNNFMAKPCAFL